MGKNNRETLIFQSFLSFRPSVSCAYVRCLNPPGRSGHALTSGMVRLKTESSIQTARKIRTAIDWMLLQCKPQIVYSKELNRQFKFRLGFITLTLPSIQQHDDSYLNKHLLKPFIRLMRDKFGLTHYIWKAETQGNGNIHWHLTVNKFIHYKHIRHHWNILLNKLGYFTHTKFNHSIFEANTTDVHSVYKVRNIAAYLSKYLSKKKQLSNSIRLSESTQVKPAVINKSEYFTDPVGLVWQYRRPVTCKSFGVSENIKTNGISFEEGSHAYNELRAWLNENTERELTPNDYIKLYIHKAVTSLNQPTFTIQNLDI